MNTNIIYWKIAAKLSFIDFTISINEVETAIEKNCETAPKILKDWEIITDNVW